MLLSAWSLVEKSAKLYKENMKLFIKYAVLLYVPSIAASLIIGVAALLFAITSGNISGVIGLGIFSFILIIISGLVSLWFSLAFVRVIADRYQGKPITNMKKEIIETKKYVWLAVGATILSGLAIIGGFFLFIIPCIIFSIWFAFVMQAVVLDNKGSVDSLKASKDLVSGRWFSVFWRILVPVFMVIVITLAIELFGKLLFSTVERTAIGDVLILIYTFISIALNVLLIPFITTVQTILYLELKKHPVQETNPVA